MGWALVIDVSSNVPGSENWPHVDHLEATQQYLSSESIFVIVLLRLNFKMPKEESDGSALGALLAPSAGLFAGYGINEL